MTSKKLILVASPPACGKTTLAKRIARELGEAVYIDKDVLNPFGVQICRLCGKNYNPDSAFFVDNVREIEYEVTINAALEALEFASRVIVNAPFGRELWDVDYMRALKEKAARLGARLYVVFITATPELCRARMTERANIRDAWKLENWESYLSVANFDAPIHLSELLKLFLYKNDTAESDADSFERLISLLSE